MNRMHRLLVMLILTALALLSLAALPALAGSAPVPIPASAGPGPAPIGRLQFTQVPTIYLPIVIVPVRPINELKITALSYSGPDEYVEIKNNGPADQVMTGWQLVSVVGAQTYDFPASFTLGVGQAVRVHSGPAAFSGAGHLYWTDAYIWNNNGDKAELRDGEGQVRDSRCYGDGC